MGPFVPDIISDELNLVFGFLIGIAFGFVLEQAGFSSSRKLTGLFYGRDFTVLRVFFTAAVTAMSGILLLAYAGMLDIDIIYINPTYLWAAIIGGVVMGIGFIVGGYCPGTSLCGAAIGKIDAMIFVFGGMLGVFLFGETYSGAEGLFNGYYYGDITFPAWLGISPGVFVLFVIVIAIAAFIITTKLERKINPAAISKTFPVRSHAIAGALVIVLGIILVFLPDRKTNLLTKISDEQYVRQQPVREMTPDELAFRILDKDPKLQIIDVRSEAEFATMRLPGSLNIPMNDMFGKQWRELLTDNKLKVLVSMDESQGRKAAVLAQELNYTNVRYLGGGLKVFKDLILNTPTSQNELTPDQIDSRRFRIKASSLIAKMIKDELVAPKKQIKVVKKVAGGCGT